jgi:hypothetical protein
LFAPACVAVSSNSNVKNKQTNKQTKKKKTLLVFSTNSLGIGLSHEQILN